MNLERTIRKMNDKMGSALGRNLYGDPVYRWAYSEAHELLHPMRVEGYEPQMQPSGLIIIAPKYQLRKKCMTLNDQWVVCRWVEPIAEYEWRRLYGYGLEWPNRGDLAPTAFDLQPGVIPDDTWTERAIQAIRQMRSRTVAQQISQDEHSIAERERKQDEARYDEIRDSLMTYDHIPGTKGGVSYPSISAA